MKLAQWPERDRALWHASKHRAGPLDESGLAATWSLATIENCERSYGRWLTWLKFEGLLDPSACPLGRVTDDRLRAFLEFYRLGRAEFTVAGTVRDIAYVCRACAPPNGVGWLTRLGHRMMNSAKPSRPKLPRMARIEDILVVADSLMDKGLELVRAGKRSGASVYRDGLIIAVLAYRPVRLRNLTDLRLGHSLIIEGSQIRIELPATETKKGVAISAPFPKALRRHMRVYLLYVRPFLQKAEGAGDEGWLWIGRRGCKMTGPQITARVTKLTRRHLGKDLSPHLFRDCIATEIAIEAPEIVGITKPVLGHASFASSQKSYNQATSLTATRRLADVISRMREGEI